MQARAKRDDLIKVLTESARKELKAAGEADRFLPQSRGRVAPPEGIVVGKSGKPKKEQGPRRFSAPGRSGKPGL